jgi:hypothetical protein
MNGKLAAWIALVMLFGSLGLPPSLAAQRSDGLDTPLPTANMCGPGDADAVHFTLAATGDTFPHENIQAVGEAEGYDVLFDAVRPFLQAADLAYTNFDGAMLEGAGYTGYPLFNFKPALATALANAGIDLVSTANNHILDRGPEGIDATLQVLAANGITQHGVVASSATERPPYLPITLSRDGAIVTVGFISATWGTNGIPDPNNQVNLLYQTNSYTNQGGVRPELLAAVRQAAAATDLVVVAPHWGYEYQFYPDSSQITAARQLAEAGADIILGAQSHTLQPVDILDVDGRQVLVIYSLANFLASQGQFQAEYYSATATIFYVGFARSADGTVRVTGYRYLPTIHVANDTRPAPISTGAEPTVITHVRTILRDPDGLRQLPPDPPAPSERIEVCPTLTFAETPDTPIRGDFAHHYATLGGTTVRPPNEALAVFGFPLGPVQRELAGDCSTITNVLYTERQRLEWQSAAPWPYRVVGTQLGPLSLRERHPDQEVSPRTDLSAADAFADPAFRSFYEQFGGLPIFGYPISGGLSETTADGATRTVQYFERARFERSPDGSIQLGLLGREFPDQQAICGGVALPAPITTTNEMPPTAPIPTDTSSIVQNLGERGIGFWLPTLAAIGLALAILALIGFAIADWRAFRSEQRPRGYRPRRTAYERFRAPSAAATTPPAPSAPRKPAAPEPDDAADWDIPSARRTERSSASDDDADDLLRQLLNQ